MTILTAPLAVVHHGTRLLTQLPRLTSLTAENAELRRRLMEQELGQAQWREQSRLQHATDTLLGLAPGHHGVVATVIGRSIVPTQHTVLLNHGAREGLTLDSVIVDQEGVIGRVIEVQPATCLVMLLTDPDSRVAGLVERTRESGLLVGDGTGRCSMIYLEADAEIQEGDRIVTAELGGPFPKGLLLGVVARVTRHGLSGSATASVIPAARLSRLEDVLCLPARPK